MTSKQQDFFGSEQSAENKYTSKIEAPIYEPKNQKPNILELYDKYKTAKLIGKIEESNVSEEEKKFLIKAAYRHTVFNYENIADYYAHASDEMKRLMEDSALVIVDFNKAIERGFVRVCEKIRDQYMTEYNEE